MSLFGYSAQRRIEAEAPLAARMRPRKLDEYVGQEAIIGPGRLLRRAIEADRLGSLIFYGPPGTGKTTLARVIANSTEAEFIAINAVLSGVKNIRESVARARTIRGEQGRRSILFVDEVHRFNKSQQDALLPWVENGTVILIGATTENPYFEVNQALVSRSRIFRLEPLEERHLRMIAEAAVSDRERGYGELDVELEDEAVDHLVDVANGDARALLNALELAVETTPADKEGTVRITLEVAEESIQQRAVFYDKEGDAHFDAISAFIKSCRGSDPDAALYWLARMIHAGEDPRFVFRRLIILASEDVGMADPDCLVRVEACAAAFDRVGMPEGRYHLAQGTLVVANAAKSNSTMGFFEALAAVKKERTEEVPDPIKDGNRDKEGFGHGMGYLYPHAYRDHWVAQQYLPAGLHGQVFYQPSDQGYEAGIREQVMRRREAQLAALEVEAVEPRGLTTGPDDRALNRWVERAMAGAGAEIGAVRDRIFAAGEVQRHHVCMELRARTGLLSWEAVRRAPEGGVYAWVTDSSDEGKRYLSTLRQQATSFDELHRPHVFDGPLAELDEILELAAPNVRFDRILGHDVLGGSLNGLDGWLPALTARLRHHGRVVLSEAVPRRAQRLSALIPNTVPINEALHQTWLAAEEALYVDANDPKTNWSEADLVSRFEEAGFETRVELDVSERQFKVGRPLLERWWKGTDARLGYAARLGLDDGALAAIRTLFDRHVLDEVVRWRTTRAVLVAKWLRGDG